MLSLVFLFSAPFVSGYGGGGGGGSRNGGGGGGGISTEKSCPDFSSISPEKNSTLQSLTRISFIVPSGYDSESIAIEVNGEAISSKITEKENGDLVVIAPLSSSLDQKGSVKISLQANSKKTKCEKNSVYFVQISSDGETEKGSEEEEKEWLLNKEEGGNEEEEGAGEPEDSGEEGENPRTNGDFSDTKDHWAKSYIERLVSRGIVQGYSDESFLPNDSVNRAEMVKIALLANERGMGPSGVSPFEDVPAESWAAPYIQRAKDLGIIYGYWGNKFFEPWAAANRAMAIKVLVESGGINVSGYRGQSPFPDVPSSSWMAPYIAWAKANSIVNGYADGNFGPNNPVTRAEIAKITVIFLEREAQD